MVYVISYDLNRPGQDYPDLFKAIKALGDWCHPVDSTWFVDTSADAVAIRDRLVRVMDGNDQMVVTRATVPGAWKGLSQDVSQWLMNHLN